MATATRHTMTPELAGRFERDVLPYRSSLQRSALRLTHHAQDAEDLVQETLVRACAGYHRFQPGTNLRAWLHRILANTFITGYRKRQREPLLVVADSEKLAAVQPPAQRLALARSAEEQALARIPSDEIVSALGALPDDFRLTVYLIDVEGLSYRETAAIMGTPIGTVMSRLHRGRTGLRSQLTTDASPSHRERRAAGYPGPTGPSRGRPIDSRPARSSGGASRNMCSRIVVPAGLVRISARSQT